MEHYECDGQINMFRYLDKYSRLFEEAGKKCKYL